jgi:hypothetical protein
MRCTVDGNILNAIDEFQDSDEELIPTLDQSESPNAVLRLPRQWMQMNATHMYCCISYMLYKLSITNVLLPVYCYT